MPGLAEVCGLDRLAGSTWFASNAKKISCSALLGEGCRTRLFRERHHSGLSREMTCDLVTVQIRRKGRENGRGAGVPIGGRILRPSSPDSVLVTRSNPAAFAIPPKVNGTGGNLSVTGWYALESDGIRDR